MYDPATARFTGVDPISDQFAELSTYNYASNDPIKNIDLWGLQGTRADIRFNQRANDFLGGKITKQEFIQGLQNEGNGAVAGASFFIPGPEDLAIAGFAATKFGSRILGGISKFGNKAIDNIFGVVPPGPGAKGSKRVKKIPEVVFDEKETPGIVQNIKDAIAAGVSNILTRQTGKSNIRKNRRAALKGKKRQNTGTSLDEFPFASSKEGGAGAHVKEVNVREQNKQGGILSAFYRKFGIKDGDKFKVKTKDK